ncbi:hypothetical protein EDB92DRAFT_2070131 [Lactarius akahatsu]|uniref:Uncharacterized protein n=1 Tax=Lactarius akahatsu TaxID=416441 RepID=A0AAD4LG04_9AGAM|nr:hypothetical protein EDB92DRAFT_2070131 [Lactarius akahatsu]
MPLHLALSWGSAETVQLLVEHGADVNTRDGSHKTPLHVALSPDSSHATSWSDLGHTAIGRAWGRR